MSAMSVPLRWEDAALRLGLTVVVGMLIGYNRAEHGKAAGMRTTLLVCLAASVAMIQVNILLPTEGRASDSFVMNDLMRLPLGILTGVGFIGAGVILRRGDAVVGVTTAATLWLVTVIGLCIGGGQITLGLSATVVGLFALWVLKWIESRLWQENRATIMITLDASGPSETDIRRELALAGLSIAGTDICSDVTGKSRRLVFEVREVRKISNTETPPIVEAMTRQLGVTHVQWRRPS
jgi:putative Mg2+ transporter-C (MgtC) family protein